MAARAHVAAALPGEPAHEAHRERILAFVDHHPDALDRTCADAHLTGSAMVVDPASRKFLLMLHAKLGGWFQPGGHADGDGTLPGVAWREATEETGIAGLRVAVPAVDLDIHEVGPPHGPHLHLDVRYLVVAPRARSRWATTSLWTCGGSAPTSCRTTAPTTACCAWPAPRRRRWRR